MRIEVSLHHWMRGIGRIDNKMKLPSLFTYACFFFSDIDAYNTHTYEQLTCWKANEFSYISYMEHFIIFYGIFDFSYRKHKGNVIFVYFFFFPKMRNQPHQVYRSNNLYIGNQWCEYLKKKINYELGREY